MASIRYTRKSAIIKPLRELIILQQHKTLIMWALDCLQPYLKIFNQAYPCDERLNNCVVQAKRWAYGEIKMGVAKRAILITHGVAKEIEDPLLIAIIHGVAQACSTVHTETHALGLVFYGLTADYLRTNDESVVNERLTYFYDKLIYWQDNIGDCQNNWADFIIKDKINKEKVWFKKELSEEGL